MTKVAFKSLLTDFTVVIRKMKCIEKYFNDIEKDYPVSDMSELRGQEEYAHAAVINGQCNEVKVKLAKLEDTMNIYFQFCDTGENIKWYRDIVKKSAFYDLKITFDEIDITVKRRLISLKKYATEDTTNFLNESLISYQTTCMSVERQDSLSFIYTSSESSDDDSGKENASGRKGKRKKIKKVSPSSSSSASSGESDSSPLPKRRKGQISEKELSNLHNDIDRCGIFDNPESFTNRRAAAAAALTPKTPATLPRETRSTTSRQKTPTPAMSLRVLDKDDIDSEATQSSQENLNVIVKANRRSRKRIDSDVEDDDDDKKMDSKHEIAQLIRSTRGNSKSIESPRASSVTAPTSRATPASSSLSIGRPSPTSSLRATPVPIARSTPLPSATVQHRDLVSDKCASSPSGKTNDSDSSRCGTPQGVTSWPVQAPRRIEHARLSHLVRDQQKDKISKDLEKKDNHRKEHQRRDHRKEQQRKEQHNKDNLKDVPNKDTSASDDILGDLLGNMERPPTTSTLPTRPLIPPTPEPERPNILEKTSSIQKSKCSPPAPLTARRTSEDSVVEKREKVVIQNSGKRRMMIMFGKDPISETMSPTSSSSSSPTDVPSENDQNKKKRTSSLSCQEATGSSNSETARRSQSKEPESTSSDQISKAVAPLTVPSNLSTTTSTVTNTLPSNKPPATPIDVSLLNDPRRRTIKNSELPAVKEVLPIGSERPFWKPYSAPNVSAKLTVNAPINIKQDPSEPPANLPNPVTNAPALNTPILNTSNSSRDNNNTSSVPTNVQSQNEERKVVIVKTEPRSGSPDFTNANSSVTASASTNTRGVIRTMNGKPFELNSGVTHKISFAPTPQRSFPLTNNHNASYNQPSQSEHLRTTSVTLPGPPHTSISVQPQPPPPPPPPPPSLPAARPPQHVPMQTSRPPMPGNLPFHGWHPMHRNGQQLPPGQFYRPQYPQNFGPLGAGQQMGPFRFPLPGQAQQPMHHPFAFNGHNPYMFPVSNRIPAPHFNQTGQLTRTQLGNPQPPSSESVQNIFDRNPSLVAALAHNTHQSLPVNPPQIPPQFSASALEQAPAFTAEIIQALNSRPMSPIPPPPPPPVLPPASATVHATAGAKLRIPAFHVSPIKTPTETLIAPEPQPFNSLFKPTSEPVERTPSVIVSTPSRAPPKTIPSKTAPLRKPPLKFSPPKCTPPKTAPPKCTSPKTAPPAPSPVDVSRKPVHPIASSPIKSCLETPVSVKSVPTPITKTAGQGTSAPSSSRRATSGEDLLQEPINLPSDNESEPSTPSSPSSTSSTSSEDVEIIREEAEPPVPAYHPGDQNDICLFCNERGSMSVCNRYPTGAQRWLMAKVKGLCTVCMGPEHKRSKKLLPNQSACPSSPLIVCKICYEKTHNYLVCRSHTSALFSPKKEELEPVDRSGTPNCSSRRCI